MGFVTPLRPLCTALKTMLHITFVFIVPLLDVLKLDFKLFVRIRDVFECV